jgi:hypothetical protein
MSILRYSECQSKIRISQVQCDYVKRHFKQCTRFAQKFYKIEPLQNTHSPIAGNSYFARYIPHGIQSVPGRRTIDETEYVLAVVHES